MTSPTMPTTNTTPNSIILYLMNGICRSFYGYDNETSFLEYFLKRKKEDT